MKKILLILMLVCMTDPAWAWWCSNFTLSAGTLTAGQTCPIGYWYGRSSLDYCDESRPAPEGWTNVYVKDNQLIFCELIGSERQYAHGDFCPMALKSTLPPTERNDLSACNACIDGATGTPPDDCKCSENTYAHRAFSYCLPCPVGTTSPKGSVSESDCVASLPENCATGSVDNCTKCNTGYSLVSGACVKNKASCKAPLKLSADGCCCTL